MYLNPQFLTGLCRIAVYVRHKLRVVRLSEFCIVDVVLAMLFFGGDLVFFFKPLVSALKLFKFSSLSHILHLGPSLPALTADSSHLFSWLASFAWLWEAVY